MCIFNVFDIRNYIEITQSIMPKPVYLLAVQEAHKEYDSLMDQIRAKYSGEYWAVGTQHLMLKPVNWQIYLLV